MWIDFFEAIGVKLQNGYGLTECSPVVAARRPTCNVLGSIGPPLRETEFKVVDPESGEVLPHGSKGVIKVMGPQVMKGYYKNPVAAKQVLDEEDWLNTGDIGWIAPHHSTGRSRRCGGFVVLEGRAKDTIVLSTGAREDDISGHVEPATPLLHENDYNQDEGNLGGLKNVLQAFKEANRVEKVIYTSSFFALGSTGGYVAAERQMHADNFFAEYEKSKANLFI